MKYLNIMLVTFVIQIASLTTFAQGEGAGVGGKETGGGHPLELKIIDKFWVNTKITNKAFQSDVGKKIGLSKKQIESYRILAEKRVILRPKKKKEGDEKQEMKEIPITIRVETKPLYLPGDKEKKYPKCALNFEATATIKLYGDCFLKFAETYSLFLAFIAHENFGLLGIEKNTLKKQSYKYSEKYYRHLTRAAVLRKDKSSPFADSYKLLEEYVPDEVIERLSSIRIRTKKTKKESKETEETPSLGDKITELEAAQEEKKNDENE